VGEVGVGVTPCEHRFHLPCWDAFSSSTLGQRPPLCPNCRKVVNSDLEAVEIDIEEEDGERFDLPRAPSSSDSLDSVDTENQRSTDVYYDSGRESSDSFSTFTNDNIPDLSSLEISVGRKQDQLNQLKSSSSIKRLWLDCRGSEESVFYARYRCIFFSWQKWQYQQSEWNRTSSCEIWQCNHDGCSHTSLRQVFPPRGKRSN
jgi:hypothetical protein